MALNASVPFAFIVDGQELPAGTYQLSTMNDEPNLLRIENNGGNALQTTVTRPDPRTPDDPEAATGEPRLIFEQLGDRAYLSEVRVPSRSFAWQLELPCEVTAEIEAGTARWTSVVGSEEGRQ